MNTRIKNFLGAALIVASLAFAIASLGYADNQQSINQGTFTVSAVGKVIAKPDIGQFQFSILTEGESNLGELQKENNATVETITSFLIDGGVKEDDIETQNFDVQPRRQYYECEFGICPPAEIIGYTINHSLSVKVRDLDNAGKLLAGVVDRGADYVSNLSFTIDNTDILEAQAQGEAINKAKEKAKAIAKTGGFKIGKILYISTSEHPTSAQLRSFEDTSNFKTATVPVQPGSEEIEVEVSVTYTIK